MDNVKRRNAKILNIQLINLINEPNNYKYIIGSYTLNPCKQYIVKL